LAKEVVAAHVDARDSRKADIAVNPGPADPFAGFAESMPMSDDVVFWVLIVFNLFSLSTVHFCLWVFASALLLSIYKNTNFTSMISQVIFLTVVRLVVISLTVYNVMTAMYLIRNDHVLPRTSAQHDIELHPGPAWESNVQVHTLRATVGTVLQLYDIRCVLASHGIAAPLLEGEVQKLYSALSTASYYQSKTDQPLEPSGTSSHAVAKAFRAVYFGAVREAYVKHLLKMYPPVWKAIRQVAVFPMHTLLHEFMAAQLSADTEDVSTGLSTLLLTSGHEDVDGSDSTTTVPPAVKEYCNVCGFDVNPVGHSERCRVNPVRSAANDEMKRSAWIGDALHTMDVRERLIGAKVKVTLMSIVGDLYKSGKAQATYIRHIGYDQLYSEPLRASDKYMSTVFESLYEGQFRDTYLHCLDADIQLVSEGKYGEAGYIVRSHESSIYHYDENCFE
jgi:hypothetical protein